MHYQVNTIQWRFSQIFRSWCIDCGLCGSLVLYFYDRRKIRHGKNKKNRTRNDHYRRKEAHAYSETGSRVAKENNKEETGTAKLMATQSGIWIQIEDLRSVREVIGSEFQPFKHPCTVKLSSQMTIQLFSTSCRFFLFGVKIVLGKKRWESSSKGSHLFILITYFMLLIQHPPALHVNVTLA